MSSTLEKHETIRIAIISIAIAFTVSVVAICITYYNKSYMELEKEAMRQGYSKQRQEWHQAPQWMPNERITKEE